jgi:sodium/potassium/calcium exchanger 2
MPFVIAFWATIPDVKIPRRHTHVLITVLMSFCWIAVLSYFVVSWMEIIGATLGIPSVIMGLLFLAAGTSAPDMLSAIIVAKQGKADQAVSLSLGSNVFDLSVGLALPWLVFWAAYQEPVAVQSSQLFVAVLTIIAPLAIILWSLIIGRWILTSRMGWFFVAMYTAFVCMHLSIASWGLCHK